MTFIGSANRFVGFDLVRFHLKQGICFEGGILNLIQVEPFDHRPPALRYDIGCRYFNAFSRYKFIVMFNRFGKGFVAVVFQPVQAGYLTFNKTAFIALKI